jgi:hypothetical protein
MASHDASALAHRPPVSLECEGRASLEAASPELYGQHYRPFHAGSQTPQHCLLACATDSASLIVAHTGIAQRTHLASASILSVVLLTLSATLWPNGVGIR